MIWHMINQAKLAVFPHKVRKVLKGANFLREETTVFSQNSAETILFLNL